MATRLQFDVSALDNASRTFVALAAQIERFAARLDRLDGTRADVEINADTSRAERDIGAFATKMRRDLEAAVKALPKITLDADSSDADRKMVELRGKIEELSGKTVGVDIDAGEAMAQISALQDELRALGAESPNIQVKADVDAALAKLAAANGEVDRLDGRKATVKVDVDKSWSDAIIQVARLGSALSALAMPAAIVAAAPQLVSLAASAVQASGALLLLPAAGLAAAAAVGTLAVGFGHVTDALGPTGTAAQMKKVNEALALLSPAAKAAVGEIRNLAPAWRELSLDVQQRLFLGVSSAIADLAGKYLPSLRGAMGSIASSFNAAFLEVSKFLAAPATVTMITGMFSNLATTVRNLAGVFAPLVTIFLQVASIGSQYLPGLTSGFTGLVTKVRDFVTSAQGIAQIKDWIQGGIDTIKSLFDIVSSGGGILSGLFDAAKSAGLDFVGTVANAASLTDTFLNSGVGQTALTSIFKTINDTVSALTPALVAVGAALGQGLVALGPALPPLATAFSDMVIAAAPLITMLGQLGAVILPPIAAALSFLSPLMGPIVAGFVGMLIIEKVSAMLAVLRGILIGFAVAQGVATAAELTGAGALGVLSAAWEALTFVMMTNPFVLIIVGLVALGAALILLWNHSETFRAIVTGAFEAVKTAVGAVVDWFAGPFVGFFVDAFAAIQNAAGAVAGFFVGAFDGIKTAVGAVIDFFVNLPANIASALSALGAAIASGAAAAWNWLLTTLQTVGTNVLSFLADLPKNVAYALGFLVGSIVKAFLAVVDEVIALPGQIAAGLQALGAFLASAAVAAGTAFVNAIVTAFNATVTWFQELPGRIGAALSAMGTFLAGVAVTAGTAFLDAIVTGFNAVVTFFVNLPGQIVAGLAALGSMLAGAAVAAGTGFLNGIVTGFNAVVGWFASLPGVIGGFFSAAGTWLLTVGGDIINGLITGLTNAGTAVLDWLGGLVDSFVQGFKDALGIASPSTVFAEIGGFIIQGLINGLQAMGAAILAAVQAIGQFLVDAFTAAISLLVGLWDNFWLGLQVIASAVFTAISAFVSATWNGIVSAFTTTIAILTAAWNLMWSTLSAVATAVFNAILSVITTVWAAIQNAFNVAVAFLTGLWNTFWTGIQLVATTIWNAISAYLAAAFAAFQALFNAVWSAISAFFTGIWNAISATATAVWNAIAAFFSGAFAAYQAAFTAIWNAISATFAAVWNAISSTATTVWNAISSFFTGAFNTFAGFFSSTWNGIVQTFSDIFGRVKQIASDVWTGITDAFKNGVNGVIGFINGFLHLVNKVTGIVGIPPIPDIPGLAEGGVLGVRLMAAGGPMNFNRVGSGFVTNGPQAIVGEGRRAYPEYVIPTDPTYRDRALGLYGALGRQLMASGGVVGADRATPAGGVPMLEGGGILGDIWDGITGVASDIWGGVTGALSTIEGWVGAGAAAAVNAAVDTAAEVIPPGFFRDLALGFGHKIAGGIQKMIADAYEKQQAAAAAAGGGMAVPSGPVMQVVQQTAAQFGWGAGPEWDALAWIIGHESGWNPTAQNPHSTAYGLFQFLNGTWASTGIAKTSDPSLQALAGMRYFQSRYGDPINAKAFWQAHGWYANGGLVDRPTLGVIGEAGPELVLPLTRPKRTNELLQQAGLADLSTRPSVTTAQGTSPGMSPAGIEARLDSLAATMGRQIGALADTLERRGAAATIQIQDRSGDPTETARSTMLALRMS